MTPGTTSTNAIYPDVNRHNMIAQPHPGYSRSGARLGMDKGDCGLVCHGHARLA
jgi:hypothetical protein